jgi:acid phosphatase family membrane protein YuiD
MLADASIKATAFRALFENLIFLSTFLSLCTAQFLKVLISLINGNRKNKLELVQVLTWRTGGMPSSHAAVVCSLCASVAYAEGIASNLFIFSFWFALVVLRDAMGVRRSVGLLGKALNDVGKQAADKKVIDFQSVKEIQGHTPLEVVLGGLLGILIATGLYFIKTRL